MPERKIWAGGLAAIAAWIILAIIAHFLPSVAAVLPADAQTILSGLIGAAIANYVPPDIQDKIKHVDDAVIEIARASDASPASESPPPMTPELKAAIVAEAPRSTPAI
jgi:RecJ-like exonuclease